MIVLTEEHGWLTELLMKSSQEIVDAIMEQVFGLINRFFTDISWIVSSSQIESLITVVITLSASFLTLLAVKQLLMTHALEMDGDPDSEPLQIVKKICIAVALITSHPFIFNSIMDISDMVYDLAIENIDAEVTAAGAWGDFISNLFIAGALLDTIWIIIYAIFIVILIFKALKRAIELAWLKVLFSLFCVDLVTAGGDRFKTFFASYLTVAFGYIIQVVSIKISLVFLMANPLADGNGPMYAIALLMFATKAPDWLNKYTYSSGAGRTLGGSARSAAQMAPQVIRALK